jgi:hypothetical protein
MIRREKAAYLGYILMKIVFTVGSALVFGIITFLVLVIPLILVAVILIAVPLGGIHWNAFAIGLAGLLGIVAVLALVFAVALVFAPSMVFFEAYALHFFGSRYEPLGSVLAALPGAAMSQSPAPLAVGLGSPSRGNRPAASLSRRGAVYSRSEGVARTPRRRMGSRSAAKAGRNSSGRYRRKARNASTVSLVIRSKS